MVKTSLPTLGERLKELRLARRLSLRALAEAAGLKSAAFVADVERGFRHPSPEVLAALSAALGEPLESLQQLDLRAPLRELREMTARNPAWAAALRRLVEAAQAGSVTPDQLIRMVQHRKALPLEEGLLNL